MYRITFAHKGETTEYTLYQPGDRNYCLTEGTLSLEVGTSGELSISIPSTNPAMGEFVCLTDEIIVYRDDTEIWRGRAMTHQYDFYLTGTLTCEGLLSYLYDTYYPPFEFTGSPTEFLEAVLENHNSQVDDWKKIYLGEVTVTDDNDYINRSSIEYNRTLTVLTDKLINDSLGGYFRIRIEDGVKYLDYLESYGTTATQPVEFGSNILDIAQEVEYADLATVILPLGAKLEDEEGNETDEYLTIESVNGGSIYYSDDAAVDEYGWIVVCNIWEDVTEASNLLTKAKSYLSQVTSAVASFDVKAIDLSLISDEYEAFNLGDYILIESEPHGINQYVELTEMKIDLLDPSNDTLTFGADTASLTDSQKTSSRNVQTALESLSARFTNIIATVVTTDYLNANYITAKEISADYVATDELEATVATFGYLTTAEALITYAQITDLDAANAVITTLTTDVANISSLLAGSAGVGTLQAIHLTSDNVVIDDAVITSAMIASLSADKITSGTIYTTQVTIQSAEGDKTLYIVDNTIQINDGDTVRIQIGEDADGDYNMYIWDVSGNLLWDALGLTEAGVSGNGGIIKDIAVADDAAIKGSKLDIESVASELTTDGSLIVDAAQVTINESTLAAEYTTITQSIGALESDAVTNVTTYYAIGVSGEEPPSEPGVDFDSAILGKMTLGEAVLGCVSWTTERLVADEDEYLWVAYLIEYVDGTTGWTTATCVTDDYVRSSVSTLQTSFSVLQGEIVSYISETIIQEALDSIGDELTEMVDQWTTVSQTVDSLSAEIGQVETTVSSNYSTLSSQITTINSTIDGISTTLTSTETKVNGALSAYEVWYAVSESSTYYPTHGDDGTTSVLGTGTLDTMVLGNSGEWTTTQPTASDDEYIWVAYYITHTDGTTEWTTPTLLTDIDMREAIEELSSQYVNISLTVDGLTTTVEKVQTTTNGIYTELSESISEVSQTANSVSATVSTLSTTVSNNYTTLSNKIETSLVLAIETDEEGNAYGVLSANATYIYLSGTQLVVDMDNITIDSSGNVTISGVFTTTSGVYTTKLTGGKVRFYYNDDVAGSLSTTFVTSDTSIRGVSLITHQQYLSLGIDDDSSTTEFTSYYYLNNGADPNDITERHYFKGTVYHDSNVHFKNQQGVQGKTTGGTDVDLIFMNSSNYACVGSTSYGTAIRGSSIQFVGTVSTNITFKNNQGVQGTSTSGTAFDILFADSSNIVRLGNASYDLVINSPLQSFCFKNAHGVQGFTTSGVSLSLIWVSSSNAIYVGHSSSYDVYIQANHTYIPSIELTYGLPYIDFHYNNSTADYTHRIIANSTGNLVASPGISSSSDERLKYDIVDMPDKYIKLFDALELRQYRFIKSKALGVGVIAQEVMSAEENLGFDESAIVTGTGEVLENGEIDYFAVDYNAIAIMACAKIKQLEQRIAELEAKA